MITLTKLKHDPAVRRALTGPILARRWWRARKRQALDEALARFTERAVGDIVMRVDDFEGHFAISPRSHLFRRLFLEGEYEPDLAQVFVEHIDPSRDVIDVGANVGFFSILAARHLSAGRVLSIEPTEAAFARLSRNVSSNDEDQKVILHRGLVSDSQGTNAIHVIPGMEEYSSIGALHPAAREVYATEQHMVASDRLDDLVAHHGLNPGLIKVDVEGAEGLVFRGATETLRKFRPVILSELSDPLLRELGDSAHELVRMLESAGYSVLDPLGRCKPGEIPFGDILCLPES